MPSPPLPQSLDDLFDHAKSFAEHSMRTQGKVPQALFALSPAGPLYHIWPSMAWLPVTDPTASEREQDSFAYNARLICTVHKATAVVVVLEASMPSTTPGLPLNILAPPGESPKPQEIVVLAGESRKTSELRIFSLLHMGSVFSTFGEYFGPAEIGLLVRFAHMLPPSSVTPAMLATARAHLKMLGITPATMRRDWSAN